MIPFSIFLITWLVLLGIFIIMAALSIIQMLRYGLPGHGTSLTTLAFSVIALIVIFGTSIYLINIDWTQHIDLFGGIQQSVIFNP